MASASWHTAEHRLCHRLGQRGFAALEDVCRVLPMAAAGSTAIPSIKIDAVLEIFVGIQPKIGIEVVNNGDARWNFNFQDFLRAQPLNLHDDRTKAVSMSRDEHVLALRDEAECRQQFGAAYAEYMKTSKRFVPFVF